MSLEFFLPNGTIDGDFLTIEELAEIPLTPLNSDTPPNPNWRERRTRQNLGGSIDWSDWTEEFNPYPELYPLAPEDMGLQVNGECRFCFEKTAHTSGYCSYECRYNAGESARITEDDDDL